MTLVHDAERPFAADEEPGQIVAGRVVGRSAEFDDRTVGQHDLDAQHVVDRHAVFERVRPAGVRGDVAADRAGPLARRIGSVVIAGPLELLREVHVDQARLDDGVAIAEIDLENPLHPRERDHHAAADGQAPAGQARAGTARHERDVELVARLRRSPRPGRASSGSNTTSGTFFSTTYPSHS